MVSCYIGDHTTGNHIQTDIITCYILRNHNRNNGSERSVKIHLILWCIWSKCLQ